MVTTFITSTNLEECARNLDSKRLGKQRAEALQIIKSIENKTGWSKHPVSKMWSGHLEALKVYHNVIVREWISRGYKNNMILYDIDESQYSIIPSTFDGTVTKYESEHNDKTFPWFFSFEPLIMSHRASLIRKNPDHYKPLFWETKIKPYMKHGYLWPTSVPTDQLINDFKMSYLTPIGTGPVHYRISSEMALKWHENKGINPQTEKKLRKDSTIYKEFEQAFAYYFPEIVDAEVREASLDH